MKPEAEVRRERQDDIEKGGSRRWLHFHFNEKERTVFAEWTKMHLFICRQVLQLSKRLNRVQPLGTIFLPLWYIYKGFKWDNICKTSGQVHMDTMFLNLSIRGLESINNVQTVKCLNAMLCFSRHPEMLLNEISS